MNLNQVTVSVKDIEKSIAFHETSGLLLIVKSPHYAWFECPEGEATFSINLVEEDNSNYGTTIYFEIKDVDEKVEGLIDKEIQIEQLPITQRYLWRETILKDPDNSKVKLFFAGDNRKNPSWKIQNNLIK